VTQLRNVVNNSQILFFWTDSFEVNCSKEPIRINESDFLSLVVSKGCKGTVDWSGSSECCPSFCPTLRMRIGHSLSVCLWSYHTSSSSPISRMQVRVLVLHSGVLIFCCVYCWVSNMPDVSRQLYLQKIRRGEGVFCNLINTRKQCFNLLHATDSPDLFMTVFGDDEECRRSWWHSQICCCFSCCGCLLSNKTYFM